jgi:cytidylate kinase
MAKLVVTIDGPAASGKSTAARMLAGKISAAFLDTGAMYRAVALAAIGAGIGGADDRRLADMIEKTAFEFSSRAGGMAVLVDGRDVTGEIRSPEVTSKVRQIASSRPVRERLVRMQREFAAGCERIVSEGRDQGTVVFPGADVKFYLTASVTERARRRLAELRTAGVEADPDRLRSEIEDRDKADSGRAVGPLKPAPDAVVVDTTELTVEQVVDRLVEHTRQRCLKRI